MLSLFKPFSKKGVLVIDTQKKTMGRVPVRIARELVKTNHARVIQRNPTIIGLRQPGRTSQSDAARLMNSPLKTILSVASIFALRGSRTEVLNSILFEINNGKLCVKATNLDTYFKGFIASDKRYKFIHDKDIQGICVNAHQLKKILAYPDECTDIHIKNGQPPGLQIGSFFVEGLSPDEFPEMQTQKECKTYPFNVTDIEKKLNFVVRAISDNKYRSSMHGVFFDLAKQRLVCADGNRLHMVPMVEAGKTQGGNCPETGVIVPSQVLRVARFLTGNGKLIENKENHSIVLDLDVSGCIDCTAGFTAIDEKFPAYEDVIPNDFARGFSVNTRDIIPVLHKALTANTNDSNAKLVIAEFSNGQLKITTKVNGRVTYQGVIQGRYSGASYSGIINAVYLTDAIHGMSGDSIEILLQNNNDEAWTIRGQSGFSAVIMPVETEK